MDSTNPYKPAAPPFPLWGVVSCGMLIGISVVVLGIASYFRLSSETTALRDSAIAGVNGTWNKKIALNVGFFTTGLVRAGSHFFKLPPEPRAAFDAIRRAEVGVYKLQEDAGWADHRAILARADREMSARRWDRVVGVSRENELVAVYFPRRSFSARRARCCVLVLQGRDLVVASASGNLDPLLLLAQKQLDLKEKRRDTHFTHCTNQQNLSTGQNAEITTRERLIPRI